MNNFSLSWVTSARTNPQLQYPPSFPTARAPIHEVFKIYRQFIQYFKSDSQQGTRHLFPQKEYTALIEANKELGRHACCDSATSLVARITHFVCRWFCKRYAHSDKEKEPSPFVKACCTSQEAGCAKAIGFGFGCLSGQVGYFIGAPLVLLTFVSGVFAGFANCGGTYCTLVDTHRRIKASQLKDSLYKVFLNHYNGLASYLLEIDAEQRKTLDNMIDTEIKHNGGDKSAAIGKIKHLIALDNSNKKLAVLNRKGEIVTAASHDARIIIDTKKESILKQLALVYSREDEEKYNEGGIFDQFFQACDHLKDQTYLNKGNNYYLTDHVLRMHSSSLDMESRLAEMQRTIEELQKKVSELEGESKHSEIPHRELNFSMPKETNDLYDTEQLPGIVIHGKLSRETTAATKPKSLDYCALEEEIRRAELIQPTHPKKVQGFNDYTTIQVNPPSKSSW